MISGVFIFLTTDESDIPLICIFFMGSTLRESRFLFIYLFEEVGDSSGDLELVSSTLLRTTGQQPPTIGLLQAHGHGVEGS